MERRWSRDSWSKQLSDLTGRKTLPTRRPLGFIFRLSQDSMEGLGSCISSHPYSQLVRDQGSRTSSRTKQSSVLLVLLGPADNTSCVLSSVLPEDRTVPIPPKLVYSNAGRTCSFLSVTFHTLQESKEVSERPLGMKSIGSE